MDSTLSATTEGTPLLLPPGRSSSADAAMVDAGRSSAAGTALLPPYKLAALQRRPPDLHLSAFALLFAECIAYAQNRVLSVAELEYKLQQLGVDVGRRLLALVCLRERQVRRETRLLPVLRFITSTVWRYLFRKVADSLERVKDKNNEYMIVENDPLFTKYISVPSDLGDLNCNAFLAGMVMGMLCSSGFACVVQAHHVPRTDGAAYPPRTVLSIQFDPAVVQREVQMS
ncbi:hypothetical protein CDCA_CDCA12G3482 [Cyanidium caldarium]|uniref:Trafficking protein particle complex subunit n=1 Tax=Cyanidium caldarium TaxID=2771 RepID=A0AAV9IYU8_CYACA|nr:hypothetical protein CDCA_CDCA12G3482 [Cyanidium caldarium]